MRGDPATAREAMVDHLLTSGVLHSERVEAALRRVQRHRFLEHWYRLEASRLQAIWQRVEFDRDHPDPESLATIYSDRSLVTRVDGYLPTASSSQPSLVSMMLEFLEIEPGMRVLEIGTGTGYNAALLAEVVGEPDAVYTIELQEDVARSAIQALAGEGYAGVHVCRGDAAAGLVEGAPFARILATVGCPDLSPRWLEQLAPGGMMLLPLRHGHVHPLVRISAEPTRQGHARGEAIEHSAFMSIQGRMSSANLWQSYLLGGLAKRPERVVSLPVSLPALREDQDPLSDRTYRAFYFFLTLASRELWRTNRGFGLADPAGPVTAILTSHGLEAHRLSRSAADTMRLLDRLSSLLVMWDDLGRPEPNAYEMAFIPRHELPGLSGRQGREWTIERTNYWQAVRLH